MFQYALFQLRWSIVQARARTIKALPSLTRCLQCLPSFRDCLTFAHPCTDTVVLNTLSSLSSLSKHQPLNVIHLYLRYSTAQEQPLKPTTNFNYGTLDCAVLRVLRHPSPCHPHVHRPSGYHHLPNFHSRRLSPGTNIRSLRERQSGHCGSQVHSAKHPQVSW